MFTGIVQGTAEVVERTPSGAGLQLKLRFPAGALAGVEVGASVSISGTCLTVTSHQGDEASFDVIAETLRCTHLSEQAPGSRVNYERAAAFGDEIGGHLLSGHVVGCVEVLDRQDADGQIDLKLRPPRDQIRYILPKGYVALDGVSLTVGRVDEEAGVFSVHLIPETLRVTTLKDVQSGARLNLEVDAMTQAAVATVERVLAQRAEGTS